MPSRVRGAPLRDVRSLLAVRALQRCRDALLLPSPTSFAPWLTSKLHVDLLNTIPFRYAVHVRYNAARSWTVEHRFSHFVDLRWVRSLPSPPTPDRRTGVTAHALARPPLLAGGVGQLPASRPPARS